MRLITLSVAKNRSYSIAFGRCYASDFSLPRPNGWKIALKNLGFEVQILVVKVFYLHFLCNFLYRSVRNHIF